MEKLFQSILALQRQLCDAGIPSIVIGGIAVGVWGDPRVTRDYAYSRLSRVCHLSTRV